MKVSWPTMSADDAAEIIQHNDMVAFSGFTPAGSPKALPAAIARRANTLHQIQQPFQIRLLTGASISAAADDALSEADAVSWRAPYQTSSGLRQKINQGQVKFVDLHLSEVAQMVNYGFLATSTWPLSKPQPLPAMGASGCPAVSAMRQPGCCGLKK